ncbi:MAG: adenosine-specific kinase [Spirochaetia bacterium]|jgi:adenosine/AMP kinase
MDAKISVVALSWQTGANIVVGQSHFIKTVEDLAEIMNSSVPGAKFGLAFCEASGPCLIRTEGNDDSLVADAVRCAEAVAAGHTFFLIMKNAFPINVLPQIKLCQEVCRIFCATANPVQVLVGSTEQGNGILGVIDGSPPKGVEGESDKADRRSMLRKFGYKF